MGMFEKGNNGYEEKSSNSGGDVFDRVANADEQEGAAYPVPGVYPVLMVDTLKMIESRKGDKLFVAELEVIQSDVPERPAGSCMQWVANFRHDPTPGAVKTFFARIMGVDGSEVTSDALRYAIGEKQPCRGRLVRLEANMVKTKSDRDFTKCTWRELPEAMQEKAQELRAEAGFAPF
jgi:hypothetical protein